jgi:hypothetical protein
VRTVQELEKFYAEKVAVLQEMKARGDLTRDWGECSLSCAKTFLEDIRGLDEFKTAQ